MNCGKTISAELVASSPYDALHLEPDAHRTLAAAINAAVRAICPPTGE